MAWLEWGDAYKATEDVFVLDGVARPLSVGLPSHVPDECIWGQSRVSWRRCEVVRLGFPGRRVDAGNIGAPGVINDVETGFGSKTVASREDGDVMVGPVFGGGGGGGVWGGGGGGGGGICRRAASSN